MGCPPFHRAVYLETLEICVSDMHESWKGAGVCQQKLFTLVRGFWVIFRIALRILPNFGHIFRFSALKQP